MEINIQGADNASVNLTGIYQFMPGVHQAQNPFWPIYKSKHAHVYIFWNNILGWLIGPESGLQHGSHYLKSKSKHYNNK